MCRGVCGCGGEEWGGTKMIKPNTGIFKVRKISLFAIPFFQAFALSRIWIPVLAINAITRKKLSCPPKLV